MRTRKPPDGRLESPIVKDILDRCSTRLDCDLHRVQVGKYKPLYGDSDRVISVGIPGQADISGRFRLRGPNFGRRIEIEVKSQTGRRSQSQIDWAERSVSGGDAYLLARSADHVETMLAKLGAGYVPTGDADADGNSILVLL